MKVEKTHRVMRGKFLVLLFCALCPGFAFQAHAQGWSFQIQFVQSGPCGMTIPLTIPALPNMGIPTQTQCESLRTTVLNVKESVPVTDDQGHYIGTCTLGFTCTPCSGSDIITAGQVNPGDVSFDGSSTGRPYFTPHQSSAFEDWARDYKQMLQSYGITSILGNTLTPHLIPQTGNKKMDHDYDSAAMNFNPVDTAIYVGGSRVANGPDDFLNKKVILFRTPEENRTEAENDWLRNHPGLGPFAPVQGDGIPYLEEGPFWSNFWTDPQLLKMEQHALFVGISTAAALSGIGEVAAAGVGVADVITWSVPIVEESVKALQDCYSGNCPSTTTIILNMAVGQASNFVSFLGETGSQAMGAAAQSGISTLHVDEVAKTEFKFIFGTLDSSRDTYETLTKKP
jgi:hypothetical protein